MSHPGTRPRTGRWYPSEREYYRTGVHDCRNTFDKRTFDLDIKGIAKKVDERMEFEDQDERTAITVLAGRALQRADWPTKSEWLEQTEHEFDTEDRDEITRAYRAWKSGYIDCALPRVVEWIKEELWRRR